MPYISISLSFSSLKRYKFAEADSFGVRAKSARIYIPRCPTSSVSYNLNSCTSRPDRAFRTAPRLWETTPPAPHRPPFAAVENKTRQRGRRQSAFFSTAEASVTINYLPCTWGRPKCICMETKNRGMEMCDK